MRLGKSSVHWEKCPFPATFINVPASPLKLSGRFRAPRASIVIKVDKGRAVEIFNVQDPGCVRRVWSAFRSSVPTNVLYRCQPSSSRPSHAPSKFCRGLPMAAVSSDFRFQATKLREGKPSE